MADTGGLLTYRKRPGCKNTGYEFELLISMLVVVRSEMRAGHFNFTVHNFDAADLDDIVFTLDQKKGYFMQLKYVTSKEEKNEIKGTELCDQSGNYSLIRYYPSYLEIKQKFSHIKDKVFIIYTNTSMHRSIGNNLREEASLHDDMIDTGGKIFTFTQNSEQYKAFSHAEDYKNKLQELSRDLNKWKEVSDKSKVLNNLADFLTKLKTLSEVDEGKPLSNELFIELQELLDELDTSEFDVFGQLPNRLEKLKLLFKKLNDFFQKSHNLAVLSDNLNGINELSAKLGKVSNSSSKSLNDKLYEIRREVYAMKMAHSKQLKNVKNDRFKNKLEEVLSQVLMWDFETWKEFMENLKIYADQLSMKELDELVKKEYEKLCGSSKTFLEFRRSMMYWREENLCLTRNLSLFWRDVVQIQRKDLMSNLLNKMKPVEKLIFKPKEKFIFMNLPERVVKIVCDDTTEMSCLRVQQSLSNADYLLVDMTVLCENVKQVLFLWRHYQFLVIVEDKDQTRAKKYKYDSIASELKTTLFSEGKKIIFITNQSDHVPISCDESEITLWQEQFKLSQLTPRSQEIVLDCQIDFQGYPVNLRSLALNSDDVTAGLIVQLLTSKRVSVGPEFSQGVSWEPKFEHDILYIPRTLFRREVIDEETFIFTEESCFAFSDCSEMISAFQQREIIYELTGEHEIDEKCNIFIISRSSSSSKLSEKYDVHWLHKMEKYFVWKRTRGDIGLIKKNLKQNADPVEYASVREVLHLSEKVTIIVGQSGMGKATEIVQLTKVLKEESRATWVLVVDLNKCADIFTSKHTPDVSHCRKLSRAHNVYMKNTITKKEDLKKKASMLLHKAANFRTKFEEQLFVQEISHSGNIVPIFFGFEKVGSDCLENAFDVIEEITHKNVRKVIITTPPTMREKLENRFSCLAFSLKPLNVEEQVELLQNMWFAPDMSTYYDSAQFVVELQALYQKYMGIDITQFASSPFHTRILGEVFRSDAKSYSEHGKILSASSINLLQPYVNFVEEKWKMYCEKCNVELGDFTHRQEAYQLKKDTMSFLKICAVKSFLSDSDFKKLKNFEDLMMQFNKGEDKLGVVQDKIKFLDDNLWAYFVALWLCENYDDNRKFIMKRLFHNEWRIVKAFLD